jgi:uncharacterized protein YndB with AHSA1/START domain
MTMPSLEHSLERSVLIRASASTVFRFFEDSQRFADWWGPGSRIDARPGGAVVIVYPNGVTASGEVLEVDEDRRIVFTYGYDDPGKPIPPGASRVTISLEEVAEGTLVRLRHELPDAATRDHHVPGWRYQLAVFANVAAREQHGGAAALVDGYFAAWGEPDASVRLRTLAAVVTPDVTFRDAFGCIRGRDDLTDHVAAVQVHMPGLCLERSGDVRQCQGAALADWIAVAKDGAPRGRGTSVFELAPDGRIRSVVGFWS